MNELSRQIEKLVPRLRRYARTLARDPERADDLLQEALCRAVAKQHLWQEGTDLRAWLFTILHNQYVNQVRRGLRESESLAGAEMELAREAGQDKCLELRDLDRALARLPDDQRAVVILIGLEGLNYEAAAQIAGVPVGTVRSRLSRGREALRQLMGIRESNLTERASGRQPSQNRLAA